MIAAQQWPKPLQRLLDWASKKGQANWLLVWATLAMDREDANGRVLDRANGCRSFVAHFQESKGFSLVVLVIRSFRGKLHT